MATEMDAAKEADIIAMHLMQYLTPSKRHAVQLAEPRASMPTPLAVVTPPSNSLSSTAGCARGPSKLSTSINIRSSLDRQARSLSLSLAAALTTLSSTAGRRWFREAAYALQPIF